VLKAGGNQAVERAVERRVWHRADELGDHRRNVVERPEDLLALVQRSGPTRHHRDERVAVASLRDERQGRRDLERGECAHLLRGVRDVLAEEAKDVPDLGQLEEHRAPVDVLHWMEPELERGHDAEVPASPSNRPEQILVLPIARDQEPSVGRDDVRRDEVVEREAAPPSEVADAAAEREAGHTRRRDDPPGGRQAEGVGRGIEVAPGGTPSALAVEAAGSTRTPRMPERSMTTPSSQVPNPGTL
jgi:hypothetical protein